ncbi:DNA-processing protein DprA [Loigolactobacillus iwatensis]|uniref:DNA-processing protein DprA n=1 Tax=Loigolactobacillus iwatensis TaxID=1267156 RepID=UPI000F7E33F7|nr:DNA-processing protein DprA [Loigolactobacillus iwatensis]
MQKRELLLQLHLAQGIGLASENHLAKLLAKLPADFDCNHLKTTQLATLAKLTAANRSRFIADFRTEAHLARCCQQGEDYLTIFDAAYPKRLRETYQPPTVLFYQGNLALLQTTCLAIVGARQATSYTPQVLKNFLPSLIKVQCTIISGLAQGADGYAHQLTLASGGQTIAVIGTGLDTYYPKQNAQLQAQVAQNGLVLSEYPLGSRPERYHFPQRNRIIAGLCHALCVTEARHHSGSLITANLALQENRSVLAVPGSIMAPLSAGCNELILAGAKPALTVRDIWEELQYF